jgi:hypothetical protein
MLWKTYAAGSYPHPVHALTVLGTVVAGGLTVGGIYFWTRFWSKRANKRGYSEGYTKALHDPSVFEKWLERAIAEGRIKDPRVQQQENEEAKAAEAAAS